MSSRLGFIRVTIAAHESSVPERVTEAWPIAVNVDEIVDVQPSAARNDGATRLNLRCPVRGLRRMYVEEDYEDVLLLMEATGAVVRKLVD